MHLQMSSSNSRADKVGRKVRVASGKLKGSDDGLRTLDSRKKGTKNMKSRGNSNVNLNETSSEMRTRRKMDLKKNSENEGKRKRIYADSGVVEDRNSGSRSKTNVVRSNMDKGKKVPRRKDHEFKDSGRNISLTTSSQFKRSDNLKRVNEKGLRTGISRSSDKREVPSARNNDLNQRKYAVGSVEKTHKKKEKGKKSLVNESEDRPKKKKQVIRIDPHDTSNKRLDDDIANIGTSKVKINSADDAGVEMSKNAQFRAIRPSFSVLSFVEDNLLGRRRDIEFRRAGYNTELAAPLDNIPFSTCSDRERIEVPVFRNKLDFFAAAKISSSFPPPDLPEIAFAGRSNVGKSSLLNAITRQWGVVRTSDKPGLTQTINFFNLGSKQCLVDLPGYGFAYAKEEVKESWEELVKEYVSTRVGLKRVCLLVDTKWGMKPRDHELIDLMERSQTKYQIVLTKTDLVFPIDVARRAMQIEENLKAKKSAVQPLMMISSKTGAGIRSLRTVLSNVARLVRC